MKPIAVRELSTASGERPFNVWIRGLQDFAGRSRIRARIDRFVAGNPGDVRSLGGRLFELRFHFGPGYRVYFGTLDDSTAVLITGGDKSSQERDIKRARSLWNAYRSPQS